MSSSIDIAFGIDDGYIPHLAALIRSIARHGPDADFRFIVLHAGVPKARQKAVETAAPRARFVWIEVGEDDVPAFADRGHLNRTTLFRLGLERLAPADCKRLLYLDADMIMLGDVREIYGADLGGRPVGAVPDCFLDAAEFGRRWSLPAASLPYFNAGLLLIDLEQVRAQSLFVKVAEFVARHNVNLPYNDQDGLNWAFWGNWRPLPPAWNAQLNMILPWESEKLHPAMQMHDKLPALVHFTGPSKPWSPNTIYHPWTWIYWRNVLTTPFALEVVASAKVSPIRLLRYWGHWLRRRPPQRAAWRPELGLAGEQGQA